MSVAVNEGRLPGENESRSPGGLIFIGLLVVLVGLALGLLLYPTLAFLAAAPPAVLVLNWVWQQPVRGLYLLLAATLIFEIFPLNFRDSLTDRVPFFLNLNNANSSAGLGGIPLTPAEIVMASVLVIWLVTGVARRTLTFSSGPIASAYLIFVVVMLVAEFHGMTSRADWLKSLWELRPQIYGFATFLMAANLIKDRQQVRHLALIFFATVAFKVGIALYRYFVTLHGNDSTYEAIMAHEESYFYALLILATVAAVIWGRGLRRRVVLLLVGISSLTYFAMVVNHRRSAELALIAGAAAIMLLAIRFDTNHRGLWVGLTLAAAVAITTLTFLFWNHTTGVTGELVRPIRSLFAPDQRDYLSNIYRVAEDANILVTFKTNPLIGTGFGVPMLVVFPMADISYIYPLWNYIPHNTLLWIGMRMGAVGNAAFWGLIGMAILQACRQLAVRKDPLITAVAAFAVGAIVAEIVQGYNDLQLDSDRNLIVLGAILGLLNRLPRLADA